MAGTAPRRAAAQAADVARNAWLGLAAVLGAGAGALGAVAPTWALVTGGIATAAAAATWASPLLAASGIVVLKSAMPLGVTAMVASIAVGAVGILAGGWRRLPPAPAIFFGLFLLIALPTVRLTQARWDHIQQFDLPMTDWEIFPVSSYEVLAALELTGMIGLAGAAALAVHSVADRDRLLLAVTTGAAVPILIGIKDKATGNLKWHDGHPSVESVFGHPNAFAVFLVAAVPTIVAFAIVARDRWVRWFAGGIAFLGLVCLLFTFTRAAWLALVIALVFGAVLAGQVRRLVIVGVAAVALMGASGAAGPVVERLQGLSVPDLSPSTVLTPNDSWSWRVVTWTRMLEQTPAWQITGSGYGSYERRTVEVFGMYGGQIPTNLQHGWRRGFGAHNDLVEQYVETGIPGLVLWSGFMLSLVATAGVLFRRHRDPVALAAFVSATALTVAATSDNVQAYDVSWFLVGGIVTAAWATYVPERRQARAPRVVPRDA